MTDVVIAPSMTMIQVAELVAQHQEDGKDVYVRVESVNGKPVCFLIREEVRWVPPMIRRQAGGL